jgi:hypothetical protein
MKTYLKLIVISVVLSTFLSGCFLKSVYTLVKDEDAVELPGISGVWEQDDQRWTFIKGGEFDDQTIIGGKGGESFEISMTDTGGDSLSDSSNLYLVVYEDLSESEIDSAYFFGKFADLNNGFYLDLLPVDFGSVSFSDNHYLPVHTFSKVELNEDSLTINLFKDSWIEEQIRDNRVRIKHERIDGDGAVLITASTEELQKFIIKYGNMSEAFREPITLSKLTDGEH